MNYFKRKTEKIFDLDKLPEGIYSFSGLEGFVKVEVDKNGHQAWNLENWFSTLDPDEIEEKRDQIIQDIKQRINTNTGIIQPSKKKRNNSFFNIFNKN